MAERHVEDALGAEVAEHGEIVVDRLAALHAEHRGDAASAMDANDVVGRLRELEHARIAADDLADGVDLDMDGLSGLRALQLRRNID